MGGVIGTIGGYEVRSRLVAAMADATARSYSARIFLPSPSVSQSLF
jgi:uncharacterized membrane protein